MDNKKDKFQFSKGVTIFSLFFAVVGISAAAASSVLFGLNESTAAAIIAACGGLAITDIVWYLKKSQAENTMKLYLSSFKEIAQMKQDMSILDNMEDKILTEMEESIDASLDDATSLIEKQDI